MSDRELNELRDELDSWRGRLDHLRVQANLGRKELRDKLRELGEKLEPACDKALKSLGELVSAGAAESRVAARSLRAGWDELRRTHRDLSGEAERERAERERAKRG